MPNNKYSVTEQPDPIHNEKPACWDLVMNDMRDRDEWGRSKYKTPLQPFNGRNASVDFYQEILDATVYCRQKIEEDKVIKEKVDALIAWVSGYDTCLPVDTMKSRLSEIQSLLQAR